MLEPVAPLLQSANRWDRRLFIFSDPDSPDVVDRKVKGLLNKLTMEKFDSISDQIIAWANKSEKEKDGRTLIQVIRLVFESAIDQATWSEMYACLCRKMMEQISSRVQDDGIKNAEGKPIAGGQLFRKYLLNRCQDDFERGWVAKEVTTAAAASKAIEDQAAKAAAEKKGDEEEEIALYSEEYYAAQKAKRQGLGLIKFIGELFKLQMLTERIMHECVKKLLGSVENPEEEGIESLCKLLTTVGQLLDTSKARAHMDVYFSRMKELTKSLNVSSRMQFMLQDILELRERKWVSRNAVAAPTTLAQIHETKAAQEKESYQRQMSMSRGGSRRGGDRGDFPQVGPDGWAVAGGNSAPRPPSKAGDLSKFGQISNKGAPLTFGPQSSIYAGKKDKRESVQRTNSSSQNIFSMLNMFSMLNNDSTAEATPKGRIFPPRQYCLLTLFDLSEMLQPKRLVLQPRSKPVEGQENAPTTAESEGSSDEEVTVEPEPIEMSDKDAKKKIEEDIKEFGAVRNLDEAEVYFTQLPAKHHTLLVDKLISFAVESKEADAQLVSDLFSRTSTKNLCTIADLESGFGGVLEFLEDIAIDAPMAFKLMAIMMKGPAFDDEQRTRLASKTDSGKLLGLLS
ncbi:armadillo-type protein [Armillaria novae-zelandiae]|uniref:Armadillo-type protein n=1 Tax=Armillaria novae-zelandiae TaxID=153914 RepID=A0AA39PMG7_9AGAR|nr:armadillo-type protein [Armillaria novae-zelandiae]